jgi:hypothetical protein
MITQERIGEKANIHLTMCIIHFLGEAPAGSRLHRTTARGPGEPVVQKGNPLRVTGNRVTLVLSTC